MLDFSAKNPILVRNILLVIFGLMLLAVLYKAGMSIRKVTLFESAKKAYNAHKLPLAEELFSKANGITLISYGDQPTTDALTALSPVRRRLEALAAQGEQAHAEKNLDVLLQTYRATQAEKQKYAPRNDTLALFFKEIEANLHVAKKLSGYLVEEKDRYLALLKSNMKSRTFKDESFLHALMIMPDEFFGGASKKKREVNALFRQYDYQKFADASNRLPFEEVVFLYGVSLRTYQTEQFNADWLVRNLERYGMDTLRRDLKTTDIEAFINHAKAYQQLTDVLPAHSAVLQLVEGKIDGFFKQAEMYAKRGSYQQAIELYQKLNAYKNTQSYVADAEQSWVLRQPERLLHKQYPNQTFALIKSGSNTWGTQVYAVGLTQENKLYYAALLKDGSSVNLEQELDRETRVEEMSVTDVLTDPAQPAIVIRAHSDKRKSSYMGFLIVDKELKPIFQLEADNLYAEQPGVLVVENPVGEGENEIAYFKLVDGQLVYDGKKADSPNQPDQSSDNEQPNQTTDDSQTPDSSVSDPSAPEASANQLVIKQSASVYAGPGAEYEGIGKVKKGDVISFLAESNGWYQIMINGKAGWVYP